MINRPVIQIVIGFLVFIGLAWFFSNIFIYFIISMIIAAILGPLTGYLTRLHVYRLHMPRFMAIILSFAALIVVLAFFILLFIPLVNEQTRILSQINYDELINNLSAPMNRLEEFLVRNKMKDPVQGSLSGELKEYISSAIKPFNIASFINNVVSLAGSFVIGLIAVIFITFFLLYEKGLLRRQFISLIPNKYFEVSIAAIYKTEKLLSNYLLGLLFQMLSIFSIVYIGLLVVGLKYALAIAVFAAIANVIPYLGPVLGAIFGVFIGLSTAPIELTQNNYFFLTLEILLVFIIVQVVDNLLLQPIIFSKSVKAHPLEIFIIIFVGATLAGIPGMIAAIPTYTVMRVSFLELYKGYRQYSVFKSN